MRTPSTVAGIALSGGVVTGLAQGVRIGISFVSVVVLARLLEPQDFGLIAAVAPIIAFVGLFQNLGLQQAIVQRRSITDEMLDETFWASAGIGFAAFLAAAALAPLAANFYGDTNVTNATIWLSVSLLIGSLSTVPLALLNRELSFARLATIEVVSACLGLSVAVVLALRGWGYHSLLLSTVAATTAATSGAWIFHRWRPRRPTWTIDRELLKFGAGLTGFNVVNFFSRSADNILIGRFIGLGALGFYDRAYKLLLFPLQNVSHPLGRVMIPLLSRLQDDPTRFRRVYVQTIWGLSILIVPGIAALTMTSTGAIAVLFGPQWAPVAPIFAWLGFVGISQLVLNPTGWIFICLGRTGAMFKLGMFTATVTVGSFVAGLPWGVEGVAAAYAISAYVLRIPALVYVTHRIGPVSWFDLVEPLITLYIATALAWGGLLWIRTQLPLGPIETVICALILCYSGAALVALANPRTRINLVQPASKAWQLLRHGVAWTS